MGLLIYLLYLTKLKKIQILLDTYQLKHFILERIKSTNLSSYKTQILIHKYIPPLIAYLRRQAQNTGNSITVLLTESEQY